MKPYKGEIKDLAVLHQSVYRKRYESNMVKHLLDRVAADIEARILVAKVIYIENVKKAEIAKQMQLFPQTKNSKSRIV